MLPLRARAARASTSARVVGAQLHRLGRVVEDPSVPDGSSRAPITTRSGCRSRGSGSPTSSRTVSCGSSRSTVPVPTRIASHSPRSRCTSRRADSPVIQRLDPSAAALRPSRVAASFQVTNGRPCSIAKVHARLSARASRSISRRPPSTPASRRAASPPRATGFGSGCANTTRATPASISACEHGPVRPVWWHGSRVTTAVVPRASRPGLGERERASAWACRPRGGSPPRPRPALGSSSTQPTRGFGPSGTPGVRASSSARRIARCSAR